MAIFDTVVVGTDFSEGADRALRFAAELCACTGARSLVLAHAHFVPLEIGALGLRGVEKVFADIEANADALLAERAGQLSSTAMRVEPITRHGAPDEVIVDVAREQKADLIVVGTHGHTGLSHLMIGSIANRVLRRAPCPTLTVGPDR